MNMQAHNALIVESDPRLLRICQTAFLVRGYDVFAVTTLDEALLHIGDRDFAVVLYDTSLDSEDELDRLMHVNEHLRSVGTAVITLYQTEHQKAVCEQVGVAYALDKAAVAFALGSVIDHLIGSDQVVIRDDDPTQPSRSAFLRAAGKNAGVLGRNL